jgi:hypothetical protein
MIVFGKEIQDKTFWLMPARPCLSDGADFFCCGFIIDSYFKNVIGPQWAAPIAIYVPPLPAGQAGLQGFFRGC